MKYRIIFMGTPLFAVPALQKLMETEKVVAVVTQPDKPRGRGLKRRPSPVKEVASSAGIPVLEPEKLREEGFWKTLKAFKPDLIVVAAYGKIIPPEILNLPPMGCWNIHASLLPKYRGAAPIQWVILNRERETGITIMQMDEGLDTGPILLQKSLTVGEEETFGELHDRLAELGAEALLEALDRHKKGLLSPHPQPSEGVSYAPPLRKEDFVLRFEEPAEVLCGRILAGDPKPGAYTFLEGKRLKCFRARALPEESPAPPGTILSAGKEGLQIATGKGILLVRELQLEGKRRLPVGEFLKGYPLKPGTLLGT